MHASTQYAAASTRVKALDADATRIGGYLIVWGSAAQRDLHGEFFTPESELGLDWFQKRPMLYQHGLDSRLKAVPVGQIDTLRPDAVGLWAEGQLDQHHAYLDAVRDLVRRGALHWSSGSLPHLTDVADDGHIRRWPIVEGSLTPTPAEPRHTAVSVVKAAVDALGLQPPILPTKAPQGGPMPQTNDSPTYAAQRPAPVKRLPIYDPAEADQPPGSGARISVGSPYDSLEAMDLLHGYMLLRGAKNWRGASERYANALAHKVSRAGLSAMKADELSHSTQTGFGDEWVPTVWSGQIWQTAREQNVVLPLFRAIEMPSNPFELPTAGVDPTVHYVPETTDEAQLTLGATNPIPDSRMGSGAVTLTASKLALRVGFSAELVEDAILPVLALYREQAVRAIAQSIDHLLLNGDTATTTDNVNAHETALGATDRRLAFDGLRKLVLVTASGQSVALSGDLDLAALRGARFLLPTARSTRPNDLAWIVDAGTYQSLLGLDTFLTMDKAGPNATAQTGQIGTMDGAPVVVSPELPQTSSDGTHGATNDKGTALCVWRPGWFVGYRRRIAVDVSYLPYTDSYQLTATVRLGLAHLDTQAASALIGI